MRRMLFIAGAAFGLYATNARAAAFTCPHAGTVATYDSGTKVQYTGTDPGDPYLCTQINAFGKPEKRLFNLLIVKPADYPSARSAMEALFTDHRQVSYVYDSPSVSRYRDTWTFLRHETVSQLNGTTVGADVFERHQQGQLGNGFDATYVMQFVPATGLWTRISFDLKAGQATGISTQGNLISLETPK